MTSDDLGATSQLSESSVLNLTFIICPHNVHEFHQVESFYTVLSGPLGHHYNVQNRSVAVHYIAARLYPTEHDFYIINTLSNNTQLFPYTVYNTQLYDQNHIVMTLSI